MRTVAFYNIDGISKAKTAKAILVLRDDGKEAWIPLSVASARFIGPNYKVRVSVPDWMYSKISWKIPTPYTKKPAAPSNPYIGCDYGNMMEEAMVLGEMLDKEELEFSMYLDSDDETGLSAISKTIDELKLRLRQIDEAARMMKDKSYA